ncbi:MAG: 4Fe-4S cluster-binding domain-containing protein [Thermoplasmatales archaeon]|nr:4Fe-4S cluster-binding domain-containing protein [Thermoplasmatales archaeon]
MLERYHSILEGKTENNYTKNKDKLEKIIEEVEDIFRNCHFCEHRCYVDRNKNKGKCRVKNSKISSHFLHYGEERVLVPSYTIFFSGCNFSCIYCQNWDISQFENGLYIEPEKMAVLIEKAEKSGAKNVNWVGGEPTPNLLYILKVLKNCNSNLPQIWNSNMYCSEETMDILRYIIDLYLTDFKYGNNSCAKNLSKIDRYFEIVTRNHEIAYRNGEMIVRHLILPNHIDCCSKPVIEWISENIPNAAVNIMDQYYPTYKAYENHEINRRITRAEYNEVYLYALKKGIILI